MGGWSWVVLLAVSTSAIASTQTTIIPASRTGLSMARRAAMPKSMAHIHPRFRTPDVSTWLVAGIAIGWYLVVNAISENALFDSLTALSLLIAFYYGLTGFACAIYYRHELTKSVKNFLLIGAGPVITHRFTAPARYPVLLTITDEKGVTATSTVVVTVHGTVTVIRELTVHFARSQWTLTEASIGALKGIRPAVLHSAHVTINGYSSDNQHEHAALQLAWNRAHTVGKFLLSGAPKPAGMTVAGHYGHYLASNRTPAGRVANRRVVITWTVSQ